MTLETELADVLCVRYVDIDASRRIVKRANVNPRRIAFKESAEENWFNIIEEVGKQDHLLDLVIAARSDFTEDAKLADFERCVRERATRTSQPKPGPIRKRALLVGVADYAEKLPALPAANRNIDALERLLGQLSFGFEVTSLRNPTRQEFLDELAKLFLVAERDELLLLYYAGHILLTDKGLVHLATQDTIPQLPNLPSRALAFSTLEQDYLGNSKAPVLMVFDACWSQVATTSYGEVATDAVNSALDTYFGRGCDKVLIASGACAGTAPWQRECSPLTASILRALWRDEVPGTGGGILTGEDLIHHLDEDDQCDSFRPLHKALHVSPARMALRGQGSATIKLKPDEQRFVASLRSAIEQGIVIPFFGDGVYGNGPLSFRSLAAELVARASQGAENRDDLGLATAAESLELFCGDRRTFLESLWTIIADQTARCEPPPAYDLLVDLKPPWLAVTVNYDRMLERRLEGAGHPYVLVSHVLRVLPPAPLNGEEPHPTLDESKAHASTMMLVVRSKDHPEVKRDPAREVELRMAGDLGVDSEKDRIVYKLLGAPFLNQLPFAQERQLDTVVIGEDDHIEFLSKLRGEGTGVPYEFVTTWFRMKKLLFLEYDLDIWHYRLIGNVFRNRKSNADGSVVIKSSYSSVAIKDPYVVRVEPSPMEQSFWRRFHPDPERVSLDLKTLVRALCPGRRS